MATPQTKANSDIRSDIEKDVPLSEAIQGFNQKYPDAQPLTEDEVVAAVKAIKFEYPEIDAKIYNIYERVANEKILPRGMYFSHTNAWITPYGYFNVDRKDLTLTSLPQGTKEEGIGYGFNYRIRARFISSRPLADDEKKQIQQAQ